MLTRFLCTFVYNHITQTGPTPRRLVWIKNVYDSHGNFMKMPIKAGFVRMEIIIMQENSMKDRRRYKRLPIELHLEVDEVFKQDNVVIKNLNASVSVFDISRSGIGFISEASLPLGYYFRARINLGNGDFFYGVIQIVRANLKDGKNIYGAEFVGLAPFLADKVDAYEKSLDK